MLSQQEKNKIKSVLKQDQNILFGYVYGSKVKGTDTEKSDIDVAVYLDKKQNNPSYLLNLARKLDKELKNKVDLRALNGRKITFLHQVLKYGQSIFSRDEKKRIEFETKTYKKYLDFKPHLEHYNQMRREKIAS